MKGTTMLLFNIHRFSTIFQTYLHYFQKIGDRSNQTKSVLYRLFDFSTSEAKSADCTNCQKGSRFPRTPSIVWDHRKANSSRGRSESFTFLPSLSHSKWKPTRGSRMKPLRHCFLSSAIRLFVSNISVWFIPIGFYIVRKDKGHMMRRIFL